MLLAPVILAVALAASPASALSDVTVDGSDPAMGQATDARLGNPRMQAWHKVSMDLGMATARVARCRVPEAPLRRAVRRLHESCGFDPDQAAFLRQRYEVNHDYWVEGDAKGACAVSPAQAASEQRALVRSLEALARGVGGSCLRLRTANRAASSVSDLTKGYGRELAAQEVREAKGRRDGTARASTP